MQVNNRQLQPYFSFVEVISLIPTLDMQGTDVLHQLIMLEEVAGTYTEDELDRIWCALINRYVKFELLEAFSFN